MAEITATPGRVRVIDSHTEGEPTRVIVEGGPDLGNGTIAERLQVFRTRFDGFRSGTVCEPRGSDVVVGALLCKPQDPAAAAAVIFFNDVGYLGMCGHGTIGLVRTLAYLGRIGNPVSIFWKLPSAPSTPNSTQTAVSPYRMSPATVTA
jgi:proline racemase